jgi:hypothetical protein
MVLPCPDSDLRLMLGRASGPGFTRAERDRCTALLSITSTLADRLVSGCECYSPVTH